MKLTGGPSIDSRSSMLHASYFAIEINKKNKKSLSLNVTNAPALGALTHKGHNFSTEHVTAKSPSCTTRH